jgi:hypothetical protein
MNIGPLIAGVGTALLPSAPSPLAGAGRAAAPRSPVSTADRASPRSIPATPGDVARRAATPGGQRTAEMLGDLLSRFMRGAFGSKATTTARTGGTSSTSSSSATGGALAFLKDKRLSAEEKLARLMVYFSSKYEKELEKKLDQFAELENGKSTASTANKASSSPLGSLGEGLSKLVSTAGAGGSLLGGNILPKLAGQLAAPVLAGAATALGMPALAPAILKAGPLIGGLASGAVASLTGGAASGTSAANGKAPASSTSSSTSTSGAAPPNEKQLMVEIQILQEKQKEMFSLVSNILRSLHDTKMAVIGNIR